MKAKLTITVWVEYEKGPVTPEIPDMREQYTQLNKLCYKIAKLFGIVKNKKRLKHSFSREILED